MIKALLLAGGLGTRLRPLTDTTPKCLVDIGGRPLLDYWFDALEAAGIRDVLINTHHLPGPVRDFIAAKNRQGFHVTESWEPRLLGSAGTISANRAWADDAEHMVIIYADNLSDLDVQTLIDAHLKHGQPMTMLLFHAPRPELCGIADLNENGVVTSFEEKPKRPKSDLANAGVYVVTAAAWREIADMNAFDIGYDMLPKFTGRMHGHIHEGYHRDIGDLDALAAAREVAPALVAGRLHQNQSPEEKTEG